MGRKRSYPPLEIFLNARHVGKLLRERSGAISFVYDPTWLAWEHRLPVSLSLPLREDRYVGAPVIAVFENLLPDNVHIRRRIAERVGAQGTDAFSLLSEIGRDCVGGLQFLREGALPNDINKLSGHPVDATQIETLLGELDHVPLGLDRARDFRISVAGAQEKTALLWHDDGWIKPSGTTPTTHIIKPPIGRLPNGMDLSNSVENEFFCLKLMAGFGLRVANAEIVNFGERKALVVERFDRLWATDGRLLRLPQEDCAQALSIAPSQKYQSEGGPGIAQIMRLLRGSDEPMRDRLDFFKTNILFWLIGATDGHAKNFSLALLPGGRFTLTPLYDVLSVQPSVDAAQVQRKHFKLAMRFGTSRHYKIGEIAARHIVETAIEAGLSRTAVETLFEEIQSSAEHAIQHATAVLAADFPEELIVSIASALKNRLRLLDTAHQS